MITEVLATIIAVAASILALSVVVQIVQELYKYVTSSQSRLYVQVLGDHIGPVATRLAYAPEFAYLRIRGPYEILRRRPAGRLLPLGPEELQAASEKTVPAWVQQALESLRLEAAAGQSVPSTYWTDFLEKLGKAGRGSIGYETARKIADFLSKHGHTWTEGGDEVGNISYTGQFRQDFDPVLIAKALEQRFVPHILKARENFRVLEDHLAYAGSRRNMRHTVVIGFLTAAIIGLPLQDIYRQATKMSPEEAVRMAETVVDIYERMSPESQEREQKTDDSLSASASRDATTTTGVLFDSLVVDSVLQRMITELWDGYRQSTGEQAQWGIILSSQWEGKHGGFWGILLYLLGCAGTAALVGFGAPFWNDILKSLLGLKRSLQSPQIGRREEEERQRHG